MALREGMGSTSDTPGRRGGVRPLSTGPRVIHRFERVAAGITHRRHDGGVSDHGLRHRLGELLRARRQAAGLSQDVLARDSGLNQALVSRVERGVVSPTVDTVERLFAALGLQLRVRAEHLDAHLDAELARLSAIPVAMRLGDSDWPYLVNQLSDLPHVIEGPLAALIQDVPITVDALDLVLAAEDLAAVAGHLRGGAGAGLHHAAGLA